MFAPASVEVEVGAGVGEAMMRRIIVWVKNNVCLAFSKYQIFTICR